MLLLNNGIFTVKIKKTLVAIMKDSEQTKWLISIACPQGFKWAFNLTNMNKFISYCKLI